MVSYLKNLINISSEKGLKLKSVLDLKIKEVIGIRSFILYFKDASFIPLDDNSLVILLENEYIAEKVVREYIYVLNSIVSKLWSGCIIKLRVCYKNAGDIAEFEIDIDKQENCKTTKNVVSFSSAGKRHTFENLVEHDGNLCAVSVAKSVSCFSVEQVVSADSGIIIRGDSSSGKTHILKAICEYYKSAGGSVYYSTGFSFMKEFTNSVRENKTSLFMEGVMNNDIIIIDDLCEILNKNGTMRAVRGLLESCIEKQKFVLFGIGEDFMNVANPDVKVLFAKCINLDLQKPDKKTKKQIAIRHIMNNNMSVEIGVIDAILDNFIEYNLEQVFNAIQRVWIYQKNKNIIVNPNLALEILGVDATHGVSNNVVYNSDSILQAVSKELKIDMKILFSAIRVKEVCYARSLAMYLCYNLGGMNYVEIGQKFGRNHSTVISSINKIEKMMQSDKAILCHIANVKALLKMI